MTDIIEPTYDDVLGAIKRLTALAQLESDPPAITKAMIWAYLHGQRDPLRPEGMTADLSTAIDELQALVALIERQPLDDVQLSQSVAMQTAAHIRTLIAFVPAELVFLRRFYDDWKTGKSDSHLRDAADAFEDTGGVIGDPVASAPAGDGVEEARWRERWYGSEPQKGSAITDERGDLIAYFGGDEATHAAVTKIVSAHNAALARPRAAVGEREA